MRWFVYSRAHQPPLLESKRLPDEAPTEAEQQQREQKHHFEQVHEQDRGYAQTVLVVALLVLSARQKTKQAIERIGGFRAAIICRPRNPKIMNVSTNVPKPPGA